jgi:hypothetical protein
MAGYNFVQRGARRQYLERSSASQIGAVITNSLIGEMDVAADSIVSAVFSSGFRAQIGCLSRIAPSSAYAL